MAKKRPIALWRIMFFSFGGNKRFSPHGNGIARRRVSGLYRGHHVKTRGSFESSIPFAGADTGEIVIAGAGKRPGEQRINSYSQGLQGLDDTRGTLGPFTHTAKELEDFLFIARAGLTGPGFIRVNGRQPL